MIALLRACTGLIVWAAVFSLLYAVEGLGCAGEWQPGTLRIALVTIWLVSLIALAWLSWRWWPKRDQPLTDWTTGVNAIVGFVSTLWTGFPVAVLSACI